MNQFLQDAISFIQSLSAIDFILYFAVLILIILIISLIYMIKNSEDMVEETKKEELDLKNIVNTIDENPTPIADMTAYEAEQEEKAIISYDELIKTAKMHPINYDGEELVDNEVKVKKVNLEQMTNNDIEEPYDKVEVKLISYEHEEAFLKALKQLNELLN